jgi:hypothetical protein
VRFYGTVATAANFPCNDPPNRGLALLNFPGGQWAHPIVNQENLRRGRLYDTSGWMGIRAKMVLAEVRPVFSSDDWGKDRSTEHLFCVDGTALHPMPVMQEAIQVCQIPLHETRWGGGSANLLREGKI